MKIEVVDADRAEAVFLGAVLARLAHHQHVDKATIYVIPRKESGWIEYLMFIQYEFGGTITIGCIQRTVDGPMEFHS